MTPPFGCFCFSAGLLLLSACGSSNSDEPIPAADSTLPVIEVTAQRWSFVPDTLQLKVGVPVIIELSSLDVHHGFNLPVFNVRADAMPQAKTRVRINPDQAGTFTFRCDYYCGSGHEEMQGQVVVDP
jgi:cytochrome c oxidase subunit 2